ncbi:hypothetical protein NE237_018533 [Protea cynaroides]|uniref:Uncharacterized protein n=1 Tax=Protea cynaroides TaxID=273540 RepID=A0A9Q0KA63_9MAGN|nr:hypothetical protein NE237_018533 [Protea cynaroides]
MEFKGICDQLSAIGKPLADQSKVLSLLTNLGSAHESFATTMLKPPVPSYSDLLPLLMSHDLRTQSHHSRTTSQKAFSSERTQKPRTGHGFTSRGYGFSQKNQRSNTQGSFKTSGQKISSTEKENVIPNGAPVERWISTNDVSTQPISSVNTNSTSIDMTTTSSDITPMVHIPTETLPVEDMVEPNVVTTSTVSDTFSSSTTEQHTPESATTHMKSNILPNPILLIVVHPQMCLHLYHTLLSPAAKQAFTNRIHGMHFLQLLHPQNLLL